MNWLRHILCVAVILSLAFPQSFAEETPPAETAESSQEVSKEAASQEIVPVEQSLSQEAGEESLVKEPSEEKEPKVQQVKLSEEEIFNMPVSLDLRNIDVNEALKFLAQKSGLNMVPTKNVSGRVALSIEAVPFRDVFDLILRSNGLAYVKIGEIYNIMTEAEYKSFYGKNFFDVRQVKVFRLKYAIPDQAFTLLDALKSDVGRVLVDKESGNVLLMDTPEKIIAMQDALLEFEKKNIVNVFVLKYARAKEVEEILRTRLDAKNVGSVKADERNNQIIVQTLPQRMQEISDLIAHLDKPTKEVLIDTKIVKIKLNDKLESGFEWEGIFGISNASGTTYLGTYPFSVMTAGSASPAFETRHTAFSSLGEIGSYPFSGTTGTLNTSTKVATGQNIHLGLFGPDRDFDALINYLNTLGTSRVLANPKIVIVNNQEAKIHIGERQAYVTTTTTTGQTTSTISEDITFIDVGIQLSVTPTINDDGYVTMKIKPEVSSVSGTLETPTGNKIPIIDTSSTETTVMIKDNSTLLIGGLRREDKFEDSKGLPYLSKIPVIGFLFRDRTDKTERSELLVMITPHIVSGTNLDVGDERAFGDKPALDYQEYRSITSDKSVLPGAAAVKPKLYRDYLDFSEKKSE